MQAMVTAAAVLYAPPAVSLSLIRCSPPLRLRASISIDVCRDYGNWWPLHFIAFTTILSAGTNVCSTRGKSALLTPLRYE